MNCYDDLFHEASQAELRLCLPVPPPRLMKFQPELKLLWQVFKRQIRSVFAHDETTKMCSAEYNDHNVGV